MPVSEGMNGQIDRQAQLASLADATTGLQLGNAEVLRRLRNFLNMDRPDCYSVYHMKEIGVEKRNDRPSTP